MDEQAFGELIGTVKAIKENTDKIPAAMTSIAIHEVQIQAIIPLVRAHEKIAQRALIVCGIFSSAAVIASRMFHT